MKRIIKGYLIGLGLACGLGFLQAITANAQGFGNMDKFTAAVDAGSTVVLGRKLNTNEYDLLVQTGNRHPALKDAIINEPNFASGVKLLKQLLAEKESNELRAEVINRAFFETHGRNSTALEQADYDAQIKQQKKWFTVILTSERDRLHSDTKERTAMINRAYSYSMGRLANADDLKYWLPRYEHYTQILGASREWLYSPKGAKDLVDSVTLYLKLKTKKQPDEAEIKKTMAVVSKDKLLFTEMLNIGMSNASKGIFGK